MSHQPVEMKVDWQDAQVQSAALDLYQSGQIARNAQTSSLIALLELQGCLASDGNGSFSLTSRGQSTLPKLLDAFYPDWSGRAQAREEMTQQESDEFLLRYEFLQNNIRFDLPIWINQESYNTLFGGDPDAEINAEQKTHLPEFKVSQDVELLIRGSMDMQLNRKLNKPIRLGVLQEMLSHIAIPERDVHDITDVDGEQPYMVMTVESLAVFNDIDVPDHLMLIWTPLHYPDLAIHLLKLIPHYVPHIHFGDIEQASFKLAERLADETGRPLRRFMPNFWSEYIDWYARDCDELNGFKGSHWTQPISSHETVRTLMLRKLWLPQTVTLLDPRLRQELNSLLS